MDKLSLKTRIKAEVVSFSGDLSVYANDFKGNIIDINADERFEAASCIKTFILADLYRQVYEGKKDLNEKLRYTPDNFVVGSGILRSLNYGIELTVKDYAVLMIIVSDNIATNIIIDYLGIDNINNTLLDLGLKNTVLHNKIDFKKYSKLGTTTPREYGFIFEKICREELWSPEISREMLSIFKEQKYNSMLTRALPQYYLDSENTGDEELIYVASKSGSMDECRNDGGIVSTPYGKYVMALFTKNFKDPLYYIDHESTLFGAKVSRLLFDQYIALGGRFY